MTPTSPTTASPRAPKPRTPSNKKKLIWCGLAILGIPLLLEVGARVRSYIKYGSTTDVFDLYQRDAATGLRVPIPNLDTELSHAKIRIESHGFRNPELAVPKPKGTLRLAFLGASPVFCVEAGANELTWPHRVASTLAAAHPERRIDYINAAVSAYGIAESKQRLETHVRPFDPDVVIIYHATRDLTMDTFTLAHAAGLAEKDETSWLEENSFLYSRLLLNLRYRKDQERGRGSVGKLQFDPALLAKRFEDRVSALVASAQSIADHVVLVTFSIRARAEQAPDLLLDNLTHAFTFTPFLTPAAILGTYDAYNDAHRRVAKRLGTGCIEAATAIPGDAEHFVDSVHLTAKGCSAMAEVVAQGLQADPIVQRLLAR